jgi:hypothetical protein
MMSPFRRDVLADHRDARAVPLEAHDGFVDAGPGIQPEHPGGSEPGRERIQVQHFLVERRQLQ